MGYQIVLLNMQTGFQMTGSTEMQKTIDASIERNKAVLGYLQDK